MIDVVLGLDLSLTAAGMVAVPKDWGGNWERVARHHVGHALPKDATETRRIGRLHQISSEVLAFAARHKCTSAIIEQYAFAARQSHAHALGEIGGSVKLALVTRAGLLVDAVHSASARKLVLGKVPKKDVKAHTRVALTRMGMPTNWTDDEADAFVVANWALSALGGHALVVPQGAAA
jgi:Holliday junction resolvasome RuvABC endonuclease subunit